MCSVQRYKNKSVAFQVPLKSILQEKITFSNKTWIDYLMLTNYDEAKLKGNQHYLKKCFIQTSQTTLSQLHSPTLTLCSQPFFMKTPSMLHVCLASDTPCGLWSSLELWHSQSQRRGDLAGPECVFYQSGGGVSLGGLQCFLMQQYSSNPEIFLWEPRPQLSLSHAIQIGLYSGNMLMSAHIPIG